MVGLQPTEANRKVNSNKDSTNNTKEKERRKTRAEAAITKQLKATHTENTDMARKNSKSYIHGQVKLTSSSYKTVETTRQ